MKLFKLPARLWQTLLLVLTAAAFSPLSVFAAEAGEEAYTPSVYATAWALLPPIIAIGLALITKEVYSSLFLGIVMGGLLYSGFSFEGTTMHVLEDGFISVLSDSYNVGILIFLVILGTMVSLMNRAGGSAAFGRWAQKKIKTRVGAQLSAIALGILIFIDDYFNCLTVGSVMRPVTDSHKVSRAKLSYLIDATAAPICIIAPISSWAAAVSGFVEGEDGFSIFVRAIPYNYYALFTIAMMILITVWNFDYGPMAKYETNALKGDLFSDSKEEKDTQRTFENPNGRVLDLILPVLVLIVCCVLGMLYSGGFFSGVDFVSAFAGSDASVGLALGRIFLIGAFLAFATGTSWGTFGILIPIVVAVFQNTDPQLMIISISACMAGAVCGDHCSPISDTTIMASAGAQCEHVTHVTTQLPYVITVAAVSFVTYLIAGFVRNVFIMLVIGFALMVATLYVIKQIAGNKQTA